MNLHYLYKKIYDEFLKKYRIDAFATDEFSPTPPYYLIRPVNELQKNYPVPYGSALFLDQEPIYKNFLPLFEDTVVQRTTSNELDDDTSLWHFRFFAFLLKPLIFVSEISPEVEQIKEKLLMTGRKTPIVYYFYHGLASLDNYREYWKQDIRVPVGHDKLFICYQNVVNSYRWHRIQFQTRIKESGLIDQGLVSFNPPIREKLEEIIKTATMRHGSKAMEKYVLNKIDMLTDPSYIDTESPNGAMSTFIDIENCQRAFVHVVSETAFYNGKLHLTEKIFKPIVAKQPFLLLGAKGNLEYFKRYGFKTFSDFWDESYDDIASDCDRVDAVYKVLEQLSKLSYQEQCAMREQMQDILEYNWNHFFYDFKSIVVDELTENMQTEFNDSFYWKNFVQQNDIAHLNKILKF